MKVIKKLNSNKILISKLFLVAACFLLTDLSFAGTGGGELQGIYDKTEGVITGYGGKLIALAGFVVGTMAAFASNIKLMIPSFVTSLVLGVGPVIVTSGITALI